MYIQADGCDALHMNCSISLSVKSNCKGGELISARTHSHTHALTHARRRTQKPFWVSSFVSTSSSVNCQPADKKNNDDVIEKHKHTRFGVGCIHKISSSETVIAKNSIDKKYQGYFVISPYFFFLHMMHLKYLSAIQTDELAGHGGVRGLQNPFFI